MNIRRLFFGNRLHRTLLPVVLLFSVLLLTGSGGHFTSRAGERTQTAASFVPRKKNNSRAVSFAAYRILSADPLVYPVPDYADHLLWYNTLVRQKLLAAQIHIPDFFTRMIFLPRIPQAFADDEEAVS